MSCGIFFTVSIFGFGCHQSMMLVACAELPKNETIPFNKSLIFWTTKTIHKNTENMKSRKNNRLHAIVLNTFFAIYGIFCAISPL